MSKNSGQIRYNGLCSANHFFLKSKKRGPKIADNSKIPDNLLPMKTVRYSILEFRCSSSGRNTDHQRVKIRVLGIPRNAGLLLWDQSLLHSIFPGKLGRFLFINIWTSSQSAAAATVKEHLARLFCRLIDRVSQQVSSAISIRAFVI